MVNVLILLWTALTSLFRSRVRLEAEILVLRQQINVLRRKSPKRFVFRTFDRLVFVGLYRLAPSIVDALTIVRPETVVRWHRAGFRSFWRWKSRRRGGRPSVPLEIRKLIRDMSLANPLWGAPRIHGELLKLGIDVAERTVSRLLPQRRSPPSQTWRTFLTNHVRDLVSVDFFTVPTARLRVLFVFVVLAHDRRRVLHFNVTEHPTAAWTTQQIVDAFPDDSAPSYLLRDRDSVYGHVFRQRLKGMRVGEVLTAPHSPWQNPFAERLIGSIRRECLNHVVVLGEQHLRRTLARYFAYYHGARTHLSLDKDAPHGRPIEQPKLDKIIV